MDETAHDGQDARDGDPGGDPRCRAYHVPDSRGLVKLDAMENPYALPDELRAQDRRARLADAAP